MSIAPVYEFKGGFTARSNGSEAGNSFLRAMIEGDQQYRANEALCAGWLRAHGAKLAHPDDGWVDRQRHNISPAYAIFDDRPVVGDLIALGSPITDAATIGSFRLVKVTKVSTGAFSGRPCYHFEPLPDRVEVPPCTIWYEHSSRTWHAEPTSP